MMNKIKAMIVLGWVAIIVATTEKANYKLILKVSEVEKRGDTEAVGPIVEGKVIATIKDIEAEGGKWGTHIKFDG